jgi:GTP-binding protein
VGQPQVIIKEIDGMKYEPIESLVVDVPQEHSGRVIELVSQKKGEMHIMEPKGDLLHLAFDIPARGLIGLRSNILTSTQGEAVMAHRFKEYQPIKGNIAGRINGVLIAMETGIATAYSIDKLQDRGQFFIAPGDEVYKGQVIGEQIRPGDLVINVTREKQLSNMRATGKDEAVRITPKINFSLEEAMEYIETDEYLEVTPKAIRMRKIYLDENERKRMMNKMASAE